LFRRDRSPDDFERTNFYPIMKPHLVLSLFLASAGALLAQTSPDTKPATAPAAAANSTFAPRLVSDVYDWEKLAVTPNAKGMRRAVFEGSTATVDKIHCHITTLNPGEKSGEPSKHLQEEVIIVKEGTVEANWDGQSKTGGPGSVIFFASGATTFLRNAGTTPCTYIVVYYYTPLTPKR
jgi:quercetin dioxygenase-like cupin family protein